MNTQPEPFTCPRCGAVSHNPHDLEQGYCGRCRWWTADPVLGQLDPPPEPTTAQQLTEALYEAKRCPKTVKSNEGQASRCLLLRGHSGVHVFTPDSDELRKNPGFYRRNA